MFSAGSQRKLWVLFCVQNKQKAQHCLLCIIPLLPLWIYKCSMITEIAVLRGPSALGIWFPALSGTSGVIIYWHHLLLTLRLQGSAKACEPAPLSPIPEYFHSIHLCLDTECLNTVAGVLSRHTDALLSHLPSQSLLPLVWTAWPRRKMSTDCMMSFRRWMEVRGSIVLWAVLQGLAHQLHEIAAFVPQCLQTELNQVCKPENCIHVLCRLMTDSIKC